MASTINATAHGLIADQPFYFANFDPTDCGVDGDTVYYVLASGLTANSFQFSDSVGGTPFVLTSAITTADLIDLDKYTLDADVMAPPTAPNAPGSCVLSSAVVVAPDGTAVTRLDITITQPTSATLRHTIVTITGDSNAVKVVIPVGQTTGSVASVVAGTSYTGTAIAYDTFGNASGSTASIAHVAAGDVTAPSTPTGLSAASGILMALVSWTGVSDADFNHFELAVSTDGGSTFPTVYRTGTTVAAISNLTAGTTYTYKVRAVDHTGNASAYTGTVSATPRKVTGSGLSGTDIEALSISGADIKANTITAAKILAGTITANEIATGTISADQVAVGAVAFAGGNLIKNGSFESGDATVLVNSPSSATVAVVDGPTLLRGWSLTGTTRVRFSTSVNAKTGLRIGSFICDSTEAARRFQQQVPVVAGRTYRLAGWTWKGAGAGATAKLRASSVAPDASTVVAFDVISGSNATSAPVFVDGTYTVPTDGTVSYLRVECLESTTPASVDEVFLFEDVSLTEVANNVVNTAATVIINNTGITIINGALTLQDSYGKTVVGASGFSGDWTDYIRLGLYNSRFLTGVVGAIASGRTAALPYWTVGNSSGTPVATFLSGGGVRITFSLLSDGKLFTSDLVPVRPAVEYSVPFSASAVWAAGALIQMATRVLWFKSDLTASATPSTGMNSVSFGNGVSSGSSSIQSFDVGVATAPVDAFYAQVQIDITQALLNSATNALSLRALGLVEAPVLDLSNVSGTGGTRFFGAAEVRGNLTVDGILTTGAIQTGTASVNMASAASATLAVTFPTPFNTTPIIIVSRSTGGATAPKVHVYASGATTTGFTAGAATGDGTTSAATVSMRWLAIDTTKLL